MILRFLEHSTITYRLGNESDLQDIKKITNQYRSELGFVMNVALKDAINKDELLVAEFQGEVIGFVDFHKRRDGWNTIREIAVRKDFKQKGVGKKLFNMVPKPRRLKCTVDNQYSNDFYKSQGMKLISVEPGRKRQLNVWVDDI
jgi:ribosomal protein S18 acetylase RimI-like enzyme